MRLLIITQKVDRHDSYLGFFHRWIEEFSAQCERVTVICLTPGDFDLPANARILSLGKPADRSGSGISKISFLINFFRYLWQERKNYDAVFVHMNPIYLVFAGIWWRLSGKVTSLWYTHKSVDWKLRVAEKFVNIIFTASPESFRLASSKVRVVGHGIDTNHFICPSAISDEENLLRIVSVGRITRIKNLHTFIRAASILKNQLSKPFRIDLVGSEVTDDDFVYRRELDKLVGELGLQGEVHFVGSVAPEMLPAYYCQAHLSVNLCPTGGMDKAVLESFACARPTLAANTTFKEYLGPELSSLLVFNFGDEADLAEKISSLYSNNILAVGKRVRFLVEERSDLRVLIKKVISHLS